MDKKVLLIVIIVVFVTILLIAGCTSEDQKTNKNEHDYEKILLSAPIFTNVSTTSYNDESLWAEYNVSTSLNTAFFTSGDTAEEILEWYNEKENIVNWTVNRSGIFSKAENPTVVSFGYLKLKSEDNLTGVYIFVKKIDETIDINDESLIGLAEGDWNLIYGCYPEPAGMG